MAKPRESRDKGAHLHRERMHCGGCDTLELLSSEAHAMVLCIAVAPLPHPDSTVRGRNALYWLIQVVGARSSPADLKTG